MNQPHPDKTKYTYFEWDDTLQEQKRMARERSWAEQREVTVPELTRLATLQLVNEDRIRRGEAPLESGETEQPRHKRRRIRVFHNGEGVSLREIKKAEKADLDTELDVIGFVEDSPLVGDLLTLGIGRHKAWFRFTSVSRPRTGMKSYNAKVVPITEGQRRGIKYEEAKAA